VRSVARDLIFGGGDGSPCDNTPKLYNYFMAIHLPDMLIRVVTITCEKLLEKAKHCCDARRNPEER
jgi:hypothetical protein